MKQEIVAPKESLPVSTLTSQQLRLRLLTWVDKMTDRRYQKFPTKAQILTCTTPQDVAVVISSLRAQQAGPTRQEWATLYGQLALEFPLKDMTEDQARLKYRTFCADLAGIPGPAIAAACVRYRREPSQDGKQKFFPQAWQLIAMCEDEKRMSANILRACDDMERILDAPEQSQTGAQAFDAMNAIKEISTKMTVNREKCQNMERERITARGTPTGRPTTDAAELRTAINRKLGVRK